MAILLSATSLSYGQRACGAMEVYSTQMIKDSLFRSNRRTITELNERFKLNTTNKRLAPLDLTVPVVVHVLYNKPDQKISKQQVLSQLTVINNDFTGRNADINTVPAPFKPLVAPDLGVRFSLALRDPDGNPTDGIKYYETTITAFGSDDNVKFKALGGADAWPSDQYLNIWVCNLGEGLLGYAQFPGGAAATDGVVINYTAFGTMGTAKAPFDKGRTLTHELGHYLGVFHIWGDDNGACNGSDEMDDTPNQAGSNGQCPTFPHVSCSNGPHGDLFMNYMDYVDDKCMVMFTKDQSVRMRSTLFNVRSSLFSSAGLLDTNTKINDAQSLFLRIY